MNNSVKILSLLLILVVVSSFKSDQLGIIEKNPTLTIVVKKIPNQKGEIVIGAFRETDEWLETTYKFRRSSSIENGQVKVVFDDLPPGKYAFSVYHDENKNGKIDTNIVGIPTEAYGFSQDKMGLMGPPDWEDCAIDISTENYITINLR